MAAKTTSLKITIENVGARETLRAFTRMDKAANQALRERSMELAESLIPLVKASARREGRQAVGLAETVKARRDRLPIIEVGGSKKVGASKVPAWRVLLGSEFGGNRRTGFFSASQFSQSAGRQFRPHLGRGSYWFFKAVYAEQAMIMRKWQQAADDIERDFLMDTGF